MKKGFLITMIALFLIPAKIKADEGMWFLMFIERLNHRDMQKMGLQLTPEEIYSINNNSLKDAIVQFNGGCTASIISKDGLILTNHHCGYDAIAELSTPEKNHLKDGFWAYDNSQELKPKSLFVRFFVRMDDVSKRILSKVNNQMTEADREKAINQEIALIQKENSENGKYTVSVRSFFQGNEYYYFVYQDFEDVRLVGTPTESIGKFGGDTDNWEWPRHTGDFSLFRVYTNKEGQPAAYSENNVPMNPKHYLPVNTSGVKEGDFAMILGYPGRTNRWLAAEGINQNVNYAYPAWVEASKTAMDVMKKYQKQDPKTNLDYASNYASVANYWKNRQGMIDALTKFKTAKAKAKQEKNFNKWANKAANKATYGNVIKEINDYYVATNHKAKHDNYLMMALRNSTFTKFSYEMNKQFTNYIKTDASKREEQKAKLSGAINETFSTTNLSLEKDMLATMLELYTNKATGYNQAKVITDHKANLRNFLNNAFDNSLFTSKEKLLAFLDNPSQEILNNDELLKITNDIFTHFYTKSDEIKSLENNYNRSFRKLVDGYRKMNPDAKYYPDANSTLRLTYGKVIKLPKDKRNDAKVNYYTTLEGMVKKHKKGDPEFDLSQPLIDLYNKKDFGTYADANGYMPVNFLTDNDITGGNSGSPVINGKGELIGLAFDGNIEAMAGDVIFDKKLQRTINVDIRFILFLIDKYANAQNLIQELTLVK